MKNGRKFYKNITGNLFQFSGEYFDEEGSDDDPQEISDEENENLEVDNTAEIQHTH